MAKNKPNKTKIEAKTYMLYTVLMLVIVSMFLFIVTNKSKITGKAIETTCPDDNTVFKISALTNAHAGTWDGSGYANKVCSTASSGHACKGYNVVARLSSTNNAHVEKKGLTTAGYSNVCFGDLTCHYYNSSGLCDSGECIATISADTNAHVGDCSAYTTRICCEILNRAPKFALDTQTAFTKLQGETFNYKFNATDEENDPITYFDNATLFDINSNTGIVSFTPSATLKGTFSVRITAGDDKGANESIAISLTITDKNFPPVITSFTPEDLDIKLEAGYDYQFAYQANDPDGTIPSSNWILDNNLKSINKTFVYSPSNSNIGKHTLKLVISDGLLNSSLAWDITIIPENHAPVLKSSIPNQELQQNSKKERAFDLDDYFSDEDGDKLIYSSKGNKDISVKINFADNTITFTTPNRWYGTEYVIFTADDGNLIATSNNITLNVKGAAIPASTSCAPSWSCTAWEPANCPIAEQQARECQDLNNCGVAAGKPAETKSCSYAPSCEDNIKNQGEEGIDCGGPCKACTPGLSPARKFQWYWWMLPFVLVMLLVTTIVYEAYNRGAKYNTTKKQELMQAYAPSAAKQRERELQHYVELMLSKGFPEESIRKRLQQEGWPPAALSRIFGFVELHKRAEGKQPIINRLVKQKESIAEQKENERARQREELFKKFER